MRTLLVVLLSILLVGCGLLQLRLSMVPYSNLDSTNSIQCNSIHGGGGRRRKIFYDDLTIDSVFITHEMLFLFSAILNARPRSGSLPLTKMMYTSCSSCVERGPKHYLEAIAAANTYSSSSRASSAIIVVD